MAGFIKPSVNGITHNRFDVDEFVWIHEGAIDYQCVVKKIFTETDEIETIVTYYILPFGVRYSIRSAIFG